MEIAHSGDGVIAPEICIFSKGKRKRTFAEAISNDRRVFYRYPPLCLSTIHKLEPVVGFEPTTDGLQNRCSTTELNWQHLICTDCWDNCTLIRYIPSGTYFGMLQTDGKLIRRSWDNPKNHNGLKRQWMMGELSKTVLSVAA